MSISGGRSASEPSHRRTVSAAHFSPKDLEMRPVYTTKCPRDLIAGDPIRNASMTLAIILVTCRCYLAELCVFDHRAR
jgi:hypothetical protein